MLSKTLVFNKSETMSNYTKKLILMNLTTISS